MKKFCVTDPCYILPDDVWSKCCKVFDEYKDDEFMYQRFDEAVTKALTEFVGSKSYACGTGYGDWSNELQGDGKVINSKFCADAGMVCVCELTDKVKEALDINETNNHSVAIFEAEDLSNVEFDLTDKGWTVVYIETTDGHCFCTLTADEYCCDEVDDYYNEDEDEDWQ